MFKKIMQMRNFNFNSKLISDKRIVNTFLKTPNSFIKNILIRKFSTSNNGKNKIAETKKLSKWKSLKQKIKTYGLFGIYCYIFSYIATFGIFYFLTKTKIINSEKFLTKAHDIGLEEYVDIKGIKEYLGPLYTDLVVALVINEVFEIIRLPLVVAMLPRIVKRFKKK